MTGGGNYNDIYNHNFVTRWGVSLDSRWCTVYWAIEVASVIELSEASGLVAAGLFMTEG